MTTAKRNAIKQQYELDGDNLWSTPRGSRPIIQARVLFKVDGLAYAVDTDAVREILKPKPKRKAKSKPASIKWQDDA